MRKKLGNEFRSSIENLAMMAEDVVLARQTAPRWMTVTLWLAGIYNLAWGAWTILRPADLFHWAGIDLPRYPEIWQCVGMIVGVYGIGYIAAARDPARHWPIVLVGFLGKVLGPIGMIPAVWKGTFPPAFAITNITNDLVWWVPFGLMLLYAWKSNGGQPAP